MFPLRATFSDSMHQDDRSDEERNMVGSWVVDEVRKAIEKGEISDNVFEFVNTLLSSDMNIRELLFRTAEIRF
jgi:hypothetical protein